MIIDKVGLFGCRVSKTIKLKATVKFICDHNDRTIAFGFIYDGWMVWDCESGRSISGITAYDIIGKWEVTGEPPLDFDWSCLPGWATGKVRWQDDDVPVWEYQTVCSKYGPDEWQLLYWEFEPKKPYPDGYEDEIEFERPKAEKGSQ